MLMNLLQININLAEFRISMLCFATAFVVAMVVMPILIKLIDRFQLYDVPDSRKEHNAPIPTMGGIAVCIGMAVACLLWLPFSNNFLIISIFLSIVILFSLGIMDDLRDMPARYKFVIQLAVASLIAIAGIRITNFNGLLGLHELPITAQYTFTVLAITGITNAFNLIDGIDGLAGGLGFMSLVILGLFLRFSNESDLALIAFALAGGLLGFLYYNFNPARIFMGDTGSLVLGFVVSILCIRLMQTNIDKHNTFLPHMPVFALGIVLIPVFDTLRVFSLRIWKGKSPFHPDKTHIHHLLTNNGWSHGFAAKLICMTHACILVLAYFLKNIRQEWGLLILLSCMLLMVLVFQHLKVPVMPAIQREKV
ncbi:MAG: undecaprenyl-phosphate alpha-N-acetylglucosaminyl 1-phosphate transferase [Chitinophagaceae bacterium]